MIYLCDGNVVCATQLSANIIMEFLNEFHAHLMLQVGVIWACGLCGVFVVWSCHSCGCEVLWL